MASDVPSLIEELKRRRVFRAVIGYGVVAFAALQIIEPIMHGLHWPDEVLTWLVLALAAGFPITVGLAWIFDVNAGQIERTRPTPNLAGPRLGITLLAIGLVAAAPGLAWYLLRARPAPAIAAAPLPPSIAVLPFSDLSEKHDQEYFADGVAEEILTALARVPGLKVIGRTSSFSFKGKGDDLKAIGQKLEVAHILEGSLRKDGDQIRVSAQLVRVTDGSELWSETYDRKLEGIFKLQDEIARTVVGALRGKLMGIEAPSVAHTPSPEVYDLFLLGRNQRRIDRPESGRRATEALEKAVALDPLFAAAWAELALVHFQDVDWTLGDAAVGMRAKALEEVEHCVALAPELPQAYAARARIRYFVQYDFAGALADIDRALLAAPNDPESLVTKSLIVRARGRPGLAEGIKYVQRATELDPLNVEAWAQRGFALIWDGQLNAAAEALARAESIAPGNSPATYFSILLYTLQGRPQATIELARRSEVPWIQLTGIALAEHDLGHEPESKAALDKLIAQDNPEATSMYQVAQVHARRGETELALGALERAYLLRDTGLDNIQVDTFFIGLAAEPRFQALVAKMQLPAR